MPVSTKRLFQLIEIWRKPKGLHRVVALLLICVLLGAVGLLVYQQGGTRSVYPHLMYAPVLLAAFYFKIPGGIIAAIAAGLVLGPFMPLNVEDDIPQTATNWLVRTGFFVMVGLLAGLAFKILNTQLDRLRHDAYRDPLTGLPNLLATREYIHQHWSKQPGVLLIVFSLVNLAEIANTLGYRKTEQLIQKLAQRLQSAFPNASLVARVDSDKFAAVVEKDNYAFNVDPATAFHDLRETHLLMDEVPIHVEASVGIARFSDVDDEPETLIPMAEIAARRAHAEGMGVAAYDEAQDSKGKENLRLLGELRHAIEKNQLLLHYQPKLQLATGRVTGVEALIRWRHPQLGIIPPGQFIPIAEHTALIKPLTHWVLEAALAQLAEWQRRGHNLEMALNLSTYNLSERDLLSKIVALIEAYEICPEKLALEITESALMYPTSETVYTLAKLRDRGIKISIDDFGTGYSSLAYLKRLPVTSLKIDRSFITHLEDSRDKIIVQTAIDFGHHLDLEVVAEGVENDEALRFLRTMDCDLAQGYYISPPIPADCLSRQKALIPG